MLILSLATLALFVLAFGYYSLLVVSEVMGWFKPNRREQQEPHVQPRRLTTLELRFATHELGRLSGFGDE